MLYCRGCYTFRNPLCSNKDDFGINKTEFVSRGKDVVCMFCKLIEKDNTRSIAIVKHYGEHTCPLIVKGRLDPITIKKSLAYFPKQIREMMVRSEIQKILESPTASYKDAVEVATDFTDTKFIENQKQNPQRREDLTVKILRQSKLSKKNLLMKIRTFVRNLTTI